MAVDPKKYIKQTNFRVTLVLLLVVVALYFVYDLRNSVIKENKAFHKIIEQTIDSSNAVVLAKIDSMNRYYNDRVIKEQNRTSSRIEKSINRLEKKD